jgi:nitroimidazol reductase NimA-like FMN-containing flavoprotein (pyridoxamine 5'-phosphate oxidase superfamily)
MAMAGRAGALLADVRHRDSLTQTIAIEIERLHEQCRSLDERLMASTVALMFGEYAAATTSDDRQKALMNAVQLLEKVSNRIEPWYRRHDMLLARGLSVITLLSGFLAAIEGVRRLVP